MLFELIYTNCIRFECLHRLTSTFLERLVAACSPWHEPVIDFV